MAGVLSSVLLTGVLPGGALAAVPAMPTQEYVVTTTNGGWIRALSTEEMHDTSGKGGGGGREVSFTERLRCPTSAQKPESCSGTTCSKQTELSGDPIYVPAAALIESFEAFSLPGPAGFNTHVRFEHTSASNDMGRWPNLSAGWYVPWFDSRFQSVSTGVYELKGFVGDRPTLTSGANGYQFDDPEFAGWDSTVYTLPNGEWWWELTDPSGITYKWLVESGGPNQQWYLRQIEDRHGNTIDLLTGMTTWWYDGAAQSWRRHVGMTDSVGRTVTLTYYTGLETNPNPRIEYHLPDGRTVTIPLLQRYGTIGQPGVPAGLIDQAGLRRYTFDYPLTNWFGFLYYDLPNLRLVRKDYGDPASPPNYLGYATFSYVNAVGRPQHNYVYDDAGTLIEHTEVTSWVSPVKISTWDGAGQLIQSTKRAVDETLTRVDSVEYLNAAGGTIGTATFTYDSGRRPLTETDAEGRTTTYTYDANGNIASKTDALGGVTTYVNDLTWNKPLTVTDPLGRTTTYTYDPATGDKLTETDYLGRTTTYTYDSQANVLTVTDYLGNVTTSTYDALGNLTSVTMPDGEVTAQTFDTMGLLLTRTVHSGTPDALTTTYGYNAIGDVTTVTTAGHTTSYWRNTWGNPITTTDAEGRVTAYEYALFYNGGSNPAKVRQVTYPDTSTVSYTYDAQGNRTSITDQLGRTTTFDYVAGCGCQLNGNLTQITYPDGSTEHFAYDLAGNQTSYTDQLGRITTSVYDAGDRLTSKTLPNGEGIVTFTYDAVGQVLTANDADSTITRTYDPTTKLLASEVTTVNGGAARTVSYGHDAYGRPSTVTYPSGRVVTRTYDGLNRLPSITSANGAEPTTSNTFTYDAYSRLATATAGNGVVSTYAYDSEGRLATLGHTTSGQADLLTLAYQYNGVNNRTHRTETGSTAAPNEHYTYNPVDRLTQVDGDPTPVHETFGYDAAGNRTSDLAGTTYTYDTLMNRLTAMGTASFTYDTNGNTATKTGSGVTTTYTWDTLNRLVGVSYSPSGDSVSYRYDALGRRIERAHTIFGSGTTTDTWVYDDQNAIAQNRNAALYQEYVHRGGLDSPLAILDHSASVAAYYYHADALGTVRTLTDAFETIAQSYTYTSYGVTTTGSPAGLDQPFRYTAREWDNATGLYYYRARYYDHVAGRFLSHDPIRHRGGLNLYEYVASNPPNRVDPLGLCELSSWNFYQGCFGLIRNCVCLYTCTSAPKTQRREPSVNSAAACSENCSNNVPAG